ncbi:hypothetical protein [Georgenia sp. AZ-5]|uniref:hypothetical protein n=1 Tax=Georgenia sp. AZ-5 TaxID=3367526 RepID=UPI003755376D
MSIPRGPAFEFGRWLGRLRAELAGLRRDVAALWREHCARARSDPGYRAALLGVLRGLLNAVGRGPRATLLWLVVLLLKIVLEAVRHLQEGPDGDDGPVFA